MTADKTPTRAVIRGTIPAAATEGAAHFAGRTWAIEQVRAWAEHGTERFLVLVAEPGWGKSALAAWLVGPEPSPPGPPAGGSTEARPVAWSAWHFCDSNLGQTTIPTQFIASLSVQLASRLDGYGYAIVKRAAPEISVEITATTVNAPVTGIETRAININAKDAREVYDQAVREPLQAVVDDGRLAGSIFILVDGLDDALGFSAPTIVDLLATSSDFPAPVRFLLTTRNESLIMGQFRDAAESRIVYLSDPNDPTLISRNDADVEAFVTAKTAEDARLKHLKAAGRTSLVAKLVSLANGNFLVARFLLSQVDPSGILPDGVPAGLYPVYDDYLGRIMPETKGPGVSPHWTDDYRPILGALSVAHPAAPSAVMPEWLGRDPGELNPFLSAVGQIVEYVKENGGGRRLYHRSLADFLAVQEIAGPLEPQPNRYFVGPREQHQRIADFYLNAVKDDWGGDWSRSDAYGLRELVPHLHSRFLLTDDLAERRAIAEALCAVALDHGFQTAQRELLGDTAATVEACRLALEVTVAGGDLALILERAGLLAKSDDPEIRIFASRMLKEASDKDHPAALAQLKALVG